MKTKTKRTIERVVFRRMVDQDPDTSWIGVFIGVDAVAHVVISGTCQKITSGGLWGIESDCGREHMEELKREQLEELRSILRDLGFSKRAIEDAFAECDDAD